MSDKLKYFDDEILKKNIESLNSLVNFIQESIVDKVKLIKSKFEKFKQQSNEENLL